jgi:Holliday junction resolvase RusA-like endonuclease
MKVLHIENCKFASLNNKYQIDRRTGGLFLSKEYRIFKDLLLKNCWPIKIDPPYRVIIEAECYHDADNFTKPVIDALEEKGVIDNDRNVLNIQIVKTPIKKNLAGKIIVYVDNLNDTRTD